jgi:hypothetical protein
MKRERGARVSRFPIAGSGRKESLRRDQQNAMFEKRLPHR